MQDWRKPKLINNLRYYTTLMAEREEQVKSLLKVKEESEKAGLKLSIEKTKKLDCLSSPAMLQIHVYGQNSEVLVNKCHRTCFWRKCTSIQLKHKTCCVPTSFTFKSMVMMITVMIVMIKTLRAQHKVRTFYVSALQYKYTLQCSTYQ